MNFGLDDKVALVTGAGRGIGRAIAKELACGQGAHVAVLDRDYEHALEVAAEIGCGSRGFRVDVVDTPAVEACVAEVEKSLGPIEILVNNAGITRDNLLARLSEEQWDTVLDVNLKGTWLCSRAAAEVMAARGQGAIVNMSWDHVLTGMGNPTAAIYGAAKGGILALSRCLAQEFAPGVRVNVVAPGWIKTKWAETADEGLSRAVVHSTPLARWGRPDDVAAAVLFLASAESSFITGETLLVGGGAVMA